MSHPYREAAGPRLPCPRCRAEDVALEEVVLVEHTVHECPRCQGLWVSREVFTDALIETDLQNAVLAVEHGHEARRQPDGTIRCPVCDRDMARKEYGRTSGVMIDDCRPHGVWLDPTELSRIIHYALERQVGERVPGVPPPTWLSADDVKRYLDASKLTSDGSWNLLGALVNRRR